MAEDRDAPKGEDEEAEATGDGGDAPQSDDASDDEAAKPSTDDESAKDDDAKDDDADDDDAKDDDAKDDDAKDDDAKSDDDGSASAKAKDGDADAEASDTDEGTKSDKDAKSDSTKPAGKGKDKEKSGGSKWWLLLVAVLVVEFYTYGRRGDIEVCVGKQDVHDFSLIGQERTDDNRWKFPRCEARVNLGLRSQYDELIEDASNVACRGATLFRNRGEGSQCTKGSDGWTTQIETSYIWPWDQRYYKHLLWFLFDE